MSSRSSLKTSLTTGQTISQAKVYDVIDSLAHVSEDGLATSSAVASAIASAVAGYQPLDSDLTAIAALTTTSFGRSLLTAASKTGAVAFATATETTTARTLALADAQTYIRTTNGSATTITVPPQASVAWLDDTEIIIFQAGAGTVTIAAGSGVTINTPETLISNKQYATMTLKRVASDAWDLSGNLEAA